MRISDWSSDVCSSDLETVDRALATREEMSPAVGESEEKFAVRTAKELAAVIDTPGVGPEVAQALVDFFAEPHNRKVLDDLLQEVRPQPAVFATRASRVSGTTVVFHGTLETMRRDTVKAQAEATGTTVSVPVSADTKERVAGKRG